MRERAKEHAFQAEGKVGKFEKKGSPRALKGMGEAGSVRDEVRELGWRHVRGPCSSW